MSYEEPDDNDLDEYEPDDLCVCPECGSDMVNSVGRDSDGNNLYECQDCGERFSEEEEDE